MTEKDPSTLAGAVSQIDAKADPSADEASLMAAADLVRMKQENVFPAELDAAFAARDLPPLRELAIRKLVLVMTNKLSPRRGARGRGAKDN